MPSTLTHNRAAWVAFPAGHEGRALASVYGSCDANGTRARIATMTNAAHANARAALMSKAPDLAGRLALAIGALDICAATVELSTANGARTCPKDWPRLASGDIDLNAVSNLARSTIADALHLLATLGE